MKTTTTKFTTKSISSFTLFTGEDHSTFAINYKKSGDNFNSYVAVLQQAFDLDAHTVASVEFDGSPKGNWKRDAARKIEAVKKIVKNANNFFIGKKNNELIIIAAEMHGDVPHIAKGIIFHDGKRHYFRFDSVNAAADKADHNIYMKGQNHSTSTNASVNTPMINTVGIRVNAPVKEFSKDMAFAASVLSDEALETAKDIIDAEIEVRAKRAKKIEACRKGVMTRKANIIAKRVKATEEEARIIAEEMKRSNAIESELDALLKATK